MKTSSPTTIIITLASLLSSSALAFPTIFSARAQPAPAAPASVSASAATPPWKVSNLDVSCTADSCSYTAQLDLADNESEPGFSTRCESNTLTTEMKACDDPTVFTKYTQSAGVFTFHLQHIWQALNSNRTIEWSPYGNYNQSTTPPGPWSFEVPVKQGGYRVVG